jgi:nicotinamidase-related amidase
MADTWNRGTALLLMDLMPLTVPAFGGDEALIERLSRTAETARAAGVGVVHVRVAFRDGYPDLGPRNKIFAMATAALDFTESNPDTGIHPLMTVQSDDAVVTKRRVGSFSGSDLDMLLRARGVHSLVLAGVTTSGVVLSTVRQAADLDYGLVVLSDGCADPDDEVQRVLMEKVLPAHADVVAIDDWTGSLKG